MPTCTVCDHPSSATISKALAIGGESVAGMAKKWGLSRQALGRHKLHLPENVMDAVEAGLLTPITPVMEKLHKFSGQIEALIKVMTKSGDFRGATTALKEARGMLELIARMQGELVPPPPVQVNVVQTQEFAIVNAAIIGALQPFPEAKAAVVLALEQVR